MELPARVQLNRIGDLAEADRCLDAMEEATGLRGDPTSEGRMYVIEGEEIGAAADRIAAHLPKGWQAHLRFEV